VESRQNLEPDEAPVREFIRAASSLTKYNIINICSIVDEFRNLSDQTPETGLAGPLEFNQPPLPQRG
jgi:hypothetical protein